VGWARSRASEAPSVDLERPDGDCADLDAAVVGRSGPGPGTGRAAGPGPGTGRARIGAGGEPDPEPAQAPEVAGGSGGAARLWIPGKRALTVGLVMTVTLVAFESLAVSTVLPIVVKDLGDISLYGWVASAFFLGTLVGIVVAGAAADRSGPARPFVIGLTLFGVGLLGASVAPSMLVLVAFRAVQGIGGGAIPAVAYASIGRAYPDALRPRIFAVLSTAWVVPGVAGPAVAVLIAEAVSWRLVFAGLLPLVMVAGVLTIGALRELGTGAAPNGRPPIMAAVRVAVGAGLALAGLSVAGPVTAALIVAAAVTGWGPLRRLMPPGTGRAAAGLPATVLSRGLLTFAFFGADTFVPLALTSLRGASGLLIGVSVTSTTIVWTVGSWVQERLAARIAGFRLIRVGLAVVVLGTVAFALIFIGAVPVGVPIAVWAAAGFGMGLAYSQTATIVLREAGPGRSGVASTSLQLADTLGTALGAGFGGAAIAVAQRYSGSAEPGLAAALAGAAGVGALGVALARRLPPGASPRAASAGAPALAPVPSGRRRNLDG
jgi:MFS family permease